MDVNLITKSSFTVIGKVGQGPSNLGPQWIKPLWSEANSKFNEISHLAKLDHTGKLAGIWGLMSDVDEQFSQWGRDGKYLAGCETEDDAIPTPQWTRWRIPSQTYIVVSCTQENYGESFRYVLNEYLPLHGYELIGAVHEFFPLHAEKDALHLYFPITKNQ